MRKDCREVQSGHIRILRGDLLYCRGEAVAAGNLVITTALGALPETIGPLAYALVEPDKDPNRLRERFARELRQLEEQWRNNREPLIEHAENQKRWLKRNGTWAIQAQKLVRYTSTWLRGLKRRAGLS